MTTNDQALPGEAIFEPEGHLAEAALACIADGQLDLVPADALAHLGACDHCSRLLGEAALLSMNAGEALSALAPLPTPAVVSTVREIAPPRRARRPLPVAAIAAALLVALLTTGPSFLDTLQGAPGAIAAARTALPFMFRVASAFVRAPWGQGSTALLVKCASALVLAVIGLQVARLTSRAQSFQEGGVR